MPRQVAVGRQGRPPQPPVAKGGCSEPTLVRRVGGVDFWYTNGLGVPMNWRGVAHGHIVTYWQESRTNTMLAFKTINSTKPADRDQFYQTCGQG